MHLLGQKPEHEVWAVLMNEFGQIGVDQQLMPQNGRLCGERITRWLFML